MTTFVKKIYPALPKLTVNGISGDVADWEQGSFQDGNIPITSTTRLRLKQTFPLINGQTYTISCASGYEILASRGTVNTVFGNPVTFVANGNTGWIVVRKVNQLDILPSEITIVQPMLNLGSIPAPYSKKTGDKMTLPVPKKNLVSTDVNGWEQGTIGLLNENSASTTRIRVINTINSINNKNYTMSCASGYELAAYIGTDNSNTSFGNPVSFTAGPKGIRLVVRKTDQSNILPSEIANIKPQLEEGTTATSYTPYSVQVNKKPQHAITKAKTGLSFNGLTDYLQLPSMTMDAIEIECSIDSVQPWGVNTFIDTRSGGSSYIRTDGTASSIINGTLSPSGVISNGVRQKVKVNMNAPFTDDVTIFSNYLKGTFTKGILYKVTCYLNGAIVAQYDFEKPSNIVGNQIIPNAKNLIPSFEDSRWTIHANAKVLGKDVLHLDATAGFQNSFVDIPCQSNQNYQILMSLPNIAPVTLDSNKNVLTDYGYKTSLPFSFKTETNASFIRIFLSNKTIVTGSFDFIRPQLYQLTGQEGTINGTPQPQNKQAKRQKYALR